MQKKIAAVYKDIVQIKEINYPGVFDFDQNMKIVLLSNKEVNEFFSDNNSYTFLRPSSRYCGSNLFTKNGLAFVQNKIGVTECKLTEEHEQTNLENLPERLRPVPTSGKKKLLLLTRQGSTCVVLFW